MDEQAKLAAEVHRRREWRFAEQERRARAKAQAQALIERREARAKAIAAKKAAEPKITRCQACIHNCRKKCWAEAVRAGHEKHYEKKREAKASPRGKFAQWGYLT